MSKPLPQISFVRVIAVIPEYNQVEVASRDGYRYALVKGSVEGLQPGSALDVMGLAEGDHLFIVHEKTIVKKAWPYT